MMAPKEFHALSQDYHPSPDVEIIIIPIRSHHIWAERSCSSGAMHERE